MAAVFIVFKIFTIYLMPNPQINHHHHRKNLMKLSLKPLIPNPNHLSPQWTHLIKIQINQAQKSCVFSKNKMENLNPRKETQKMFLRTSVKRFLTF